MTTISNDDPHNLDHVKEDPFHRALFDHPGHFIGSMAC
jgi:hypothetical protein